MSAQRIFDAKQKNRRKRYDACDELERATRLELASRHPTNRLRQFAGALPDLGLNRASRDGGASEFAV